MANDQKTGRPISYNVDYFPHYCKDPKGMNLIIHKYKSEGYMGFYRIQEALGDADNHFIDLNNDLKKQIFEMHMGVSNEITYGVIDILLGVGYLDKELYEDGYLWSDKFIDSIRAVYINRIRKDPNRHIPQKEDCYMDSTSRNTSIVEYSKEKDSKEKKSKDLPLSDFQDKYSHLSDVSKSLDKYKSFADNPTKEGATRWLDKEKNVKPPQFEKTTTGYFKAWCSKCGKRELPNDMYKLNKGSECCRVEYLNHDSKKQT